MDNLFQGGWFGGYWFRMMLHDRTFLIVIAAVTLLAFLILRMSRRK